MFRYNSSMAKHTKIRAFSITCRTCQQAFITGSAIKHHCSPECRIKEKALAFSGVDSCWEWDGSINPKTGYGQLSAWENEKRMLYTAHRISYQAFNGAIPKSMCVCHVCDNKKCFNPKHLFIGTQKENLADMFTKNRKIVLKGVAHPKAVMTEAQVHSLRDGLVTPMEMAKNLNITYQSALHAKKGITWRHI
jgi:hypothetical protein